MRRLITFVGLAAVHFAATVAAIQLLVFNLAGEFPHGAGIAGRVLEMVVLVLGFPLANVLFDADAFPWFGPEWQSMGLLAANSLLALTIGFGIARQIRGPTVRRALNSSPAA